MVDSDWQQRDLIPGSVQGQEGAPWMGEAVPAQGRAWNERSFEAQLWFHLPHPEKVPGQGHSSQGFLKDVQKHPGVVQAESAVGIRPAAALENPLDP